MTKIDVQLWGHNGAFDHVQAELNRAIEEHGYGKTPFNPDTGDHAKLVVLVEEVGEVANAMTYDEGSLENLKKELIQVAAMAIAWWASLEYS